MADRTPQPNGCKRVISGECSGPDDPWCACTDQMLRAAAQEPPASTSTDVKDGRCQKCGGFPLLDECGCLSGPWQEPPAKGGDR